MTPQPLSGMYALHTDPNFHRVVVGKFTICRQDEQNVWIQKDGEEGAAFPNHLFERAISKFFDANF